MNKHKRKNITIMKMLVEVEVEAVTIWRMKMRMKDNVDLVQMRNSWKKPWRKTQDSSSIRLTVYSQQDAFHAVKQDRYDEVEGED